MSAAETGKIIRSFRHDRQRRTGAVASHAALLDDSKYEDGKQGDQMSL
jgi:hypothetical protein